MTKLFVSGFPLEINELELAKLIAPHGDILTIKIVRDRQTGKCKGYAFVEMVSLAGAENAVIALDGITMQDRELTVKINEEKPVVQKPTFNKSKDAYHKPAVKRNSFVTPPQTDESRVKRPRRPRI
ncbi:RNA recognition motif domain-containing protein [Mucilaginibacter aquatilis]|uniref:RNA-binding protein n=1 Tax=Mucilaginibacter aquatilis TaxID=1517760 RepID=A0A6I4IBU1_9SPHI|nr:RNA-binding protein [Mucilaginibacter aquatilis]MVN92671.1 RNA-binding protein [Mucilaginibacter aquatilis]